MPLVRSKAYYAEQTRRASGSYAKQRWLLAKNEIAPHVFDGLSASGT